MSWKNHVYVDGQWATNACVYATEKEADMAGVELLSRWFVPTDHKAIECDEKVNYRFNFETFSNERIEQ